MPILLWLWLRNTDDRRLMLGAGVVMAGLTLATGYAWSWLDVLVRSGGYAWVPIGLLG